MASREALVRQAIRFEGPKRIPIWFVNCDQTEGDVIVYHLSLDKPEQADRGTNEWGYHLEKLGDGTMTEPTLWVNAADVSEVEANYDAGVVTVRMRNGVGYKVFPDYGKDVSQTADRIVNEINAGENE